MLKNILLLTTSTLLLSGCFNEKKEEKWTAFIYPDKTNSKRNIKSPINFSSLEKCKKASIKQIKNQNLQKNAIFKCGLNCNWHDGMKIEICEKMYSSL